MTKLSSPRPKMGEEQALRELWNRHSKKLLRTLLWITKCREDAEDALQDTFLRAFAHVSGFDGRSQFSTWLTRIAINSGLMILRKERARPQVSLDGVAEHESWRLNAIIDHRVDIERQFVEAERSASLQIAIRDLRPALRHVVELHQQHGCAMKELARVRWNLYPGSKVPVTARQDNPAQLKKVTRAVDRMVSVERPMYFYDYSIRM